MRARLNTFSQELLRFIAKLFGARERNEWVAAKGQSLLFALVATRQSPQPRSTGLDPKLKTGAV
jgi:hypothetical protein